MHLPTRLLIVTGMLWAIGVTNAGEIAKLHQEAAANNRNGDNPPKTDEPKDAKHEITEIGVERTPCFGTCPVYTLIIQSDGAFRYHGGDNAPRAGDFTGKMAKGRWAKLAKAAADCEFMGLKSDYSNPVTDHSMVFTMVVMDKRRKTVSDYAHAGPAKLREFEEMIDDSIADAEWVKVGDTVPTKSKPQP